MSQPSYHCSTPLYRQICYLWHYFIIAFPCQHNRILSFGKRLSPWDRIESPSVPWVAAQYSLHPQPASFHYPIPIDRFIGVLGTGRMKTACFLWIDFGKPAGFPRKKFLIKTDSCQKQRFHRIINGYLFSLIHFILISLNFSCNTSSPLLNISVSVIITIAGNTKTNNDYS